MCGIVGLYSKAPGVGEQLGAHLSRMLVEMGSRGPDSAGVAIYRDPVDAGFAKLSLHAPGEETVDWDGVEATLAARFGSARTRLAGPRHACVTVSAEAGELQRWAAAAFPSLRTMSAGSAIEIIKEAVAPAEFARRFALDELRGSHALGHTRMATESRVTTEGSHPFSTGADLCLVHNGSLSNHNRLRRVLRREGIAFQTENDSEVAAGYLSWRMREGATLEQALEGCLDDLDGFYTFAVGTVDGFAVLRDPIACKPAVMAETDDWVAMASEYRALALLPGAEDATVWEPEPGRVYSWGKELVA
ncbi:glutamine amidotransferase family protein [Conexibacter stalactiti]|uniref:Glutamine amidotransferase family protein n=1 Tax=Conexibacter stalactiti TaxID=1940611 RepID=A0ABU4HL93_9ACTN|nr:glutamine amidotransferase family protein [Conexibacter stalactiti]MDW5594073.1 glutamine amidotransferase family protein [Conexibacter stalactiti]MEC5034715.1 glutamine amidotransferase family protein [Conexibacter stalactiti]